MVIKIAYLLKHFSYLGIIITLLGGIVGLPIPDEVLLTYVGYNVFLGKLSYILSLLSAFAGSIGGISISYFLGIKLGLPFLHKFGPKLHISEGKIERTKTLFSKLGPYLLFIGYFIPGVRHLTAYLAGINGYSYKKFALFGYSGAIVWSFTFITLGRSLGQKWHFVEFYLIRYRMFGVPFLVLALLIVLYVFWRRKKSSAKPNQVFD